MSYPNFILRYINLLLSAQAASLNIIRTRYVYSSLLRQGEEQFLQLLHLFEITRSRKMVIMWSTNNFDLNAVYMN
jgi:hypothetical protein